MYLPIFTYYFEEDDDTEIDMFYIAELDPTDIYRSDEDPDEDTVSMFDLNVVEEYLGLDYEIGPEDIFVDKIRLSKDINSARRNMLEMFFIKIDV